MGWMGARRVHVRVASRVARHTMPHPCRVMRLTRGLLGSCCVPLPDTPTVRAHCDAHTLNTRARQGGAVEVLRNFETPNEVAPFRARIRRPAARRMPPGTTAPCAFADVPI